MPDQGGDPYSEMLGENQGGVQGFARRYLARKSGADIHAADERQAMRIQEGQRLHNDALSAAQYGMDEFFTPERVKYAKSLGVDLGGVQSIAQQRKQLMAEDENQFAQMSGGGAPPAAGAGPAGQTVSSPATAGGPPASTGGGVQPIAQGPRPPLNADDGQPNWHGHDWAAHAQSEPPEEKAAYDKAIFYMNKARHAERFGLPTAKAYHDMAAFYGKDYSNRVVKRLGFSNASALETQRAGDAMSRTSMVQNREDARQQAEFKHKDADNDTSRSKYIATSNAKHDALLKQRTSILSKRWPDADSARAAAEAYNTQVDNQQADDAAFGIKKQGEHIDIGDVKIKGGITLPIVGRVGGTETTPLSPEKVEETGKKAARPAGVGTDWVQGAVKGKPAWISPDKTKAVFIGA
jgi:hypothetical protein